MSYLKEKADPNCVKCLGAGIRNNGYFDYPCNCSNETFHHFPSAAEEVLMLRKEIEQLQQENEGMAEKHAEKDIVIANLIQENDRLKKELSEQQEDSHTYFNLYTKYYRLYHKVDEE